MNQPIFRVNKISLAPRSPALVLIGEDTSCPPRGAEDIRSIAQRTSRHGLRLGSSSRARDKPAAEASSSREKPEESLGAVSVARPRVESSVPLPTRLPTVPISISRSALGSRGFRVFAAAVSARSQKQTRGVRRLRGRKLECSPPAEWRTLENHRLATRANGYPSAGDIRAVRRCECEL